jgi:hypothetical protein
MKEQTIEIERARATPRMPPPPPTTATATQTTPAQYAAVQTSPMSSPLGMVVASTHAQAGAGAGAGGASPEAHGMSALRSSPAGMSPSNTRTTDIVRGTPVSSMHIVAREEDASRWQTPAHQAAASPLPDVCDTKQPPVPAPQPQQLLHAGHSSIHQEELARNRRDMAVLSAHIRASRHNHEGPSSSSSPLASTSSSFLPSLPSHAPPAAAYWPAQSTATASHLDHLAIRFVLRLNVGLGIVKEDDAFAESVRREV